MEFIGADGIAAPRLAECRLDRGAAAEAFALLLHDVEIHLDCGLVHGDLSAYNVLYLDGRPRLIDLPQAVVIDDAVMRGRCSSVTSTICAAMSAGAASRSMRLRLLCASGNGASRCDRCRPSGSSNADSRRDGGAGSPMRTAPPAVRASRASRSRHAQRPTAGRWRRRRAAAPGCATARATVPKTSRFSGARRARTNMSWATAVEEPYTAGSDTSHADGYGVAVRSMKMNSSTPTANGSSRSRVCAIQRNRITTLT
jgi:RIO1 family